MSTLSPNEKSKLEKLFEMEKGYVLDFSDPTFGNFFKDNFNINIHAEEYQSQGTSKANKLRVFWQVNPDYLVCVLIEKFIEQIEINQNNQSLISECKTIAKRLHSNLNLDHLKATDYFKKSEHLRLLINRMQESVNTDPTLAIGTAKELIETCCKTILEEQEGKISNNSSIQELMKHTIKVLDLVPNNIPNDKPTENTIKNILQNLSGIVHHINELRNLHGTGHGRSCSTEGLEPRHARLATSAAVALVTFLFDTYNRVRPHAN